MAEKMTLDRMAQNANAARRVGDERTAEYWTEQVELANLREALSEWDALKGSPDHG
jgi:hypothetical protein